MEAIAGKSTSVIDEDIPCIQCGYDLRTLEITSKCPECGHEVASSVTAWRTDKIGLCDAPSAWLRGMHEGFGLIIASNLLTLSPALLPLDLVQRLMLPEPYLCIACIGWTFAHWGVWRITRTISLPVTWSHAPLARFTLLALIFISVLTPAWFSIEWAILMMYKIRLNKNLDEIGRWSMLTNAVCMMICVGAMLQCAQLARRRRESAAIAILGVLVVITQAIYWIGARNAYLGRSSLEEILGLTTPTIGAPMVILMLRFEFVNFIQNFLSMHSIFMGWHALLGLLCLIFSVVAFVRLSLALCRRRASG
jgi:hypothetical protein